MVGNDDCGTDRETIHGIKAEVIAVGVDTSDLNLISRLANIAQVTHGDDILGS